MSSFNLINCLPEFLVHVSPANGSDVITLKHENDYVKFVARPKIYSKYRTSDQFVKS